MLSTLILDLDGPILEGSERHYQCYAGILREAGFKPLPKAEYWGMKRRRMDRKLQLEASQAAHFYEGFLRHWLERIEKPEYLALDRLQEGALEKLGAWKASGLALWLATRRGSEAALKAQLEGLGLAPLFSRVFVVPGEGSLAKAKALGPALGKAPGEFLWIGDTEDDVESAKALGIRVCALACGLREEGFLRSLGPDWLAPSLAEFELPQK